VAASFAYLVVSWVVRPWVWGDTPWVLDGTNAFIDCLARGDLVACRFRDEMNEAGFMSPIGDWPLLQHIPDVISVELGADSHPARTRVLALLSVAGVVGAVAMAWAVLSRAGQRAWFWGFMLVVLAGPVLPYGRGTQGEMLAMGLIVALVGATLLQAPPPVIALAALGASLSKETAYPFLAALGLLGLLLARQRTGRPIRRHVAWGAGGLLAGFVLASLFNVVRFGSILNTNYLQPELHTPGIWRKLDYAVALLVSPNGGVFVFWPAAAALLVALCLVPLLARSRRQVDVRPAVVLGAMMLLLTAGFASWWDPFGSGYGPRLTLPWVLPLLLLALAAYGEELAAPVGRLLAPAWRLLLVFAAVLAVTLPHVGHLWRPDKIADFGAGRPACVAPWRGGVEEWHDCHRGNVWHLGDRPLLLHALDGVGTAWGALTAAVVAAGILGCLVLLRAELPRLRPRRSR
jgi:hypothetical protein